MNLSSAKVVSFIYFEKITQGTHVFAFQICLSLVRLLHYLAHSPLGSVTLLDFRPRQFVIVDGELKVTDLDDASIEESSCTSNSDCFMEFPARNFTLPCSVEGRCESMNEKRNLYNAYRYVIG